MTYLSIITAAAKSAKVSVALLYSICSHESNGFILDYAQYDNGSPSFGVCQIKHETAKMFGFKGQPMELRNAEVSTKYSALYLKYQLDRYNGNVCKATASYNSGTYMESTKKPGFPKNLKYVRLVQKRLDKSLQPMLNCEGNDYLINQLGELR
jgi:soluble lytic murein transglycosylase-like protein